MTEQLNCVICNKLFFRASPRFNKKQCRQLSNNVRPGNAITCSRLCARKLLVTRRCRK